MLQAFVRVRDAALQGHLRQKKVFIFSNLPNAEVRAFI